jgi:hypothetical protein
MATHADAEGTKEDTAVNPRRKEKSFSHAVQTETDVKTTPDI